MLMPSLNGAKTRKHKTRNHSNLRPKHRQTKDFLKVYYPYLPLVAVTLVILSILQPWQALISHSQGVLPYATQMSVNGLVQATNERRIAQSEPTLQLNAQLTKAAQIKAQDMVAENYWSHSTPSGNAPWEFINNAGYSYKKAGENLAYGFDNESEVVAGWMNSPSHRENMLDANYQDVGFGFADSKDFAGQGPATVVVAMYGQPTGAAGVAAANNQGYNNLTMTTEPTDTNVNRMQSWFNVPLWVNYVIAAAVGGLVVYLIIKHSRQVKRKLSSGEKFVMKHPLADATIVGLVVLGVLVIQRTGIIR